MRIKKKLNFFLKTRFVLKNYYIFVSVTKQKQNKMQDLNKTLEQIQKAENTIFSVTFTKKDGSERTMVARLNVKKGVNGKGMAYNPIEKGLLPVWDMQKNGFRMINLKTVTELKIKGEELV